MVVWIIVPKADNDFCLGYSYTERKYYDIHKTKSENDDVLMFSSKEKASKYLERNHLNDKYKIQDCWKNVHVCGECANFIGCGDWNLCCSAKHPTPKEREKGLTYPFGFLCYEDSMACDLFTLIPKISKEDYAKKYCHNCGSQRCEGLDTDWFDGCRHKYELEGYGE